MFHSASAGLPSGSPVGRVLYGDGGGGFSAVGKMMLGEAGAGREKNIFSQTMRERPFRLARTNRSWAQDRPSLMPDEIGCVSHGLYSPRMVGHIPNPHAPKPQDSIPGYVGYVPRKIPENIFFDRFKVANERARTIDQEKGSIPGPLGDPGLQAIPRVPGYMGYVPGVNAETVHGLGWESRNEAAQELRRDNPIMRSDGWLHADLGQPFCRTDMTMISHPNRSNRIDIQEYFSEEQQARSRRNMLEAGQKMGIGVGRPRLVKKPDRVHNFAAEDNYRNHNSHRYLDLLWTHQDKFRQEAHQLPVAGHKKAGHGQLEEMRALVAGGLMQGPV